MPRMTPPIIRSSLKAGTTAATTAPLYIGSSPRGTEHPVTVREVIPDRRYDDGRDFTQDPREADRIRPPDHHRRERRVRRDEDGIPQDAGRNGVRRAERERALQRVGDDEAREERGRRGDRQRNAGDLVENPEEPDVE